MYILSAAFHLYLCRQSYFILYSSREVFGILCLSLQIMSNHNDDVASLILVEDVQDGGVSPVQVAPVQAAPNGSVNGAVSPVQVAPVQAAPNGNVDMRQRSVVSHLNAKCWRLP